MNKIKLRSYIVDYLLIILLAFLYALNYELFVLKKTLHLRVSAALVQ